MPRNDANGLVMGLMSAWMGIREDQLPCTHDGVPVKVGMTVYCVRTKDGGATWYVTEERIVAIRYGGIEVESHPNQYSMLSWGYNAFHSTQESAEAEARSDTWI